MKTCLQCLFCLIAPGLLLRASDLNVSYSNNGVSRLSYRGVVLEDLNASPSDAFHIWHMKATDLKGNVLTGPQYTWGELNLGRTWNPVDRTWTYRFVWGSISVRFVQSGDKLDMQVTTTNNASSGIIFDGATIYPFALHFPELPLGFENSSYGQFAFNTTGPSVTVADFGSGEVAAVNPGAFKPLYSGYQPAGTPNVYFPIMSGTLLDSMAPFSRTTTGPCSQEKATSLPFRCALRLRERRLPRSQWTPTNAGRACGHPPLTGLTDALSERFISPVLLMEIPICPAAMPITRAVTSTTATPEISTYARPPA